MNAMRGRGASMFVRAVSRRWTYYHDMASSTLALNFSVKSAFVKTPDRRSLRSGNEARAWSPVVHHMSTAASQAAAEEGTSEKAKEIHSEKPASGTSDEKPAMTTSNYWGLLPKTLYEEDGTPWRWTCFSPHQSYLPDVSIDIEKHHKRTTWTDSVAYWTVKSLRFPSDVFFQKRYGCRAMMLETVAAVPGMVGGMLLHCKSLRKFETSGGWIKALLNEQMHLMTFMEVAKPKWWERGLVFVVQGVWFNAYFLAYVLNPRFAHRLTGYLEEEAIWSYSHFLQEIDNGHIPNGPAPAIAIDCWRLPENATIRDVVLVVRADEAHHRDVNHFAAEYTSYIQLVDWLMS